MDTIEQAETAIKTDVNELEGHTRESAVAWLEAKFQESLKAIHDFFNAGEVDIDGLMDKDAPVAASDPEPEVYAEPAPVDTPAEPTA